MNQWHTLEPHGVVRQQYTEVAHVLSTTDASCRLVQHGPNELVEHGRKSPRRIAWEQSSATMVVILIIKDRA